MGERETEKPQFETANELLVGLCMQIPNTVFIHCNCLQLVLVICVIIQVKDFNTKALCWVVLFFSSVV